jgi:hypothetical protein
MQRLPDGTFRFSPQDLVAYLEGDFAAWCERTQAERTRTGEAEPVERGWATPDEETELVFRYGRDHEFD